MEYADNSSGAEEAVLKRLQKRLKALAGARALQGPVLKATVEENCDDSWYIAGGDIRIGIAASLTSKEKKAVCEALEGLDVDYEVDDDDKEAVAAYGDVDVTALQGVMAKLPDCAAGQGVPRGAVLISGKGRLEVFFQEQPSREVHGFKMFGQVKSEGDLHALEGAGCRLNVCEDERYGRGYSDCFCQTGNTQSTTLNDAEFLK
ncbi:uncharacterized protein LOC117649894 [Thrips palmi]|uniref:Uncharacterized protein LOC117649894 n=1 Tax=Thrips palmi TaxID=161013 RepID=A0A6P8ZUV8_THRPL|nr:uncharacterized protein LOC117649894 [Thrips palmi]